MFMEIVKFIINYLELFVLIEIHVKQNAKMIKKLLLILLCTPLIGFGQGIYPYGYEKGSILVNDYGDTIYTITKNEDG